MSPTRTVTFISVGVSALTLLLPASMQLHIELVLEAFLASIMIGAALVFLTSLGGFTPKLRLAYTFIALGIVLYALGLVQLPVLEFISQFKTPYVTYGGINIVYIVSALLIVIGGCRYTRLVQAHTLAAEPLVILAFILLNVAVLINMPHATIGEFYPSLLALRANVGMATTQAALLFLACWQIAVIKQNTGPAYTNALAWTLLGLGALALATYTTVYFQLVGFNNIIINSGLFFLPFIVGAFCNLKGAVSFSSIVRY